MTEIYKNSKNKQNHMENPLALIGMLLIFLGIVFIIISAIHGTGEIKSGGGAVIFIGPIPIAIGTDKKWVITILITGIIIYLLFIFSRNRIY